MPGNANSGRRKKPSAFSKIDGNPGKRPIPDEPEFGNLEIVPPADMLKGMDDFAISEWHRIVPKLSELGVASIMDASLLAAYCVACSMAFKASEDIKQSGQLIIGEDSRGNITTKKNPSVKIFLESTATAKSLLTEMGLTPTTRMKLVVKKQEEDDPMANLLRVK